MKSFKLQTTLHKNKTISYIEQIRFYSNILTTNLRLLTP